MNKKWLKSITQFHQLIYSDPILRMHWEHGVSQCHKTGFATKGGDHLLSMINQNISQPPAYSSSEFVGVPIGVCLVELMQNQNGRALFADIRVNLALKDILNEYSKSLLTPESVKYLTKEEGVGWFCQQANKKIRNQDYKIDLNLPNYGYKCWNDWFIREFKEGLRPIGANKPAEVDDDDIITNSCESSPIQNPKQPQRDCQISDKFWLKENRYSLLDMFGGRKYKKQHLAKHFEGGTVYQAFLDALFYHRWHCPVDGQIQDIYQIDSCYYFDQSQFIEYDSLSQCGCQHFLTGVSTRKVMVIKSNNQKIGRIALIYVGMGEISSCISTANIGDKVKKGDQLGYFMYGGSTCVMIFQKKAKLCFRCEKQNYYQEKNYNFIQMKQNVNSYLAHVL